MSNLYFLQLENTVFSKDDQKLLNLISVQKKMRIQKMRLDINKKLCLYSDLLVRLLICQKYKLLNSELIFLKNKYGKPFCSNKQKFHFNISHTKNAIVVGVSKRPIGVDVEKIKKQNLALAKRFFTQNEYQYIMEKESEIRFFEVWTKKEAYLKFIGKGITVSLNSFDVLDNAFENFCEFRIKDYFVSVYGATILKDQIKFITEKKLILDIFQIFNNNLFF